MDNLTYGARLDLAVEELRQQTTLNWLGTARKFKVNRTTLQRRFEGTQRSYRVARSEDHQCLSITQEETLIGFINSLTNRSMPPTSQIVHNVAVELSGGFVNKN
jgi:hypothetical protein